MSAAGADAHIQIFNMEHQRGQKSTNKSIELQEICLNFFKNNEGSVCYSLASQWFVDLRDYLSHVCQCVPLS